MYKVHDIHVLQNGLRTRTLNEEHNLGILDDIFGMAIRGIVLINGKNALAFCLSMMSHANSRNEPAQDNEQSNKIHARLTCLLQLQAVENTGCQQ